MEYSIFLAKIMGPALIAVTLHFLIYFKKYQKLVDDLMKSEALMFIMSGFGLLIGLFLVTTHNVWVNGWQVLITLVGWATLIKTLFFMLWPMAALKLAGYFKDQSAFIAISLVVMLIFGMMLAYMGYIA